MIDSVYLYVCPSVTVQYHVKMTQAGVLSYGLHWIVVEDSTALPNAISYRVLSCLWF